MISCQKEFCVPYLEGLPVPRGLLVDDSGASKLLSLGRVKSFERASKSLVIKFAIANTLALSEVPNVNILKTAINSESILKGAVSTSGESLLKAVHFKSCRENHFKSCSF